MKNSYMLLEKKVLKRNTFGLCLTLHLSVQEANIC